MTAMAKHFYHRLPAALHVTRPSEEDPLILLNINSAACFIPAHRALPWVQPLSARCLHYANVFMCLWSWVWAQQGRHN